MLTVSVLLSLRICEQSQETQLLMAMDQEYSIKLTTGDAYQSIADETARGFEVRWSLVEGKIRSILKYITLLKLFSLKGTCSVHPYLPVMMPVLCRGVPQWRLWAPYGQLLNGKYI